MSRKSRGSPGNVLFITIDQLRADCVTGALSRFVPTPHLDALMAEACVFANHHTVTNPCGPARASLLTGLYASNHGAVRNGTPLTHRLTNIAMEVRKLEMEPLLFGYTDSQPDPTTRHDNDPDLFVYEGVMPGFREIVEMRLEYGFEWPAYLRARGYDVALPLDRGRLYRPQGGELGRPALYRAEDSDTAYLTDRTLEALDIRRGAGPWFAHVTFIRPHPPLVAPAPYHELIDPSRLPPPLPRHAAPDHPFMQAWFCEPTQHSLHWGFDGDCAGMTAATNRLLRATYLGLLAEVDHHLGRLLDWLEASGQADETLVIVTADHGEMLGDYDMWGKASVFNQAFHVPLIVRAPGCAVRGIDAFTESVDIAPTILNWLGGEIPRTFDGRALTPWLKGETPQDWRDSASIEIWFDQPGHPTRFERYFQTEGLRASIRQDGEHREIRLGDRGTWQEPWIIENP